MFSKKKYPAKPMKTHRPPRPATKLWLDLQRKRQRLAAKEKEEETIEVLSFLDDYQELVWCALAGVSALGVLLIQLVTA